MIRRIKFFLPVVALLLGACVTTEQKPDWYKPEVADADRDYAAGVIWGPDATCIDEARRSGVSASKAASACACIKGVMASKLSKETVDFIVTRRPQWGDPVPQFVKTDADNAANEGLRICG